MAKIKACKSHFQFKKIIFNSLDNPNNHNYFYFKNRFLAFQSNYTPVFAPFQAENRFPRLGVQLHCIRKMQKMGKSRIYENADECGIFRLFLPSCTDIAHLFPCRYEVGWVFIFSVDLFPYTSKGPIFTALPGFGQFLQQKRGFPSFLERRKSINFNRFLAVFSHFSD